MKISKLFHWLYALIMFLPVFFWIPTAFYYGFNENATAPEKQVPITESVEIDFNQLFNIPDNTYNSTSPFGQFLTTSPARSENHYYIIKGIFEGNFEKIHINVSNYISTNSPQFDLTEDNNFQYRFYATNGIQSLVFYAQNYTESTPITFRNLQLFDLTQMFGQANEPSIDEFNAIFTNNYYPYTLSDSRVIQVPTGNYRTYSDITQNMNYAWQDVWSLPMFSWTHDTFFSAPFNYIAGLFGIQAGNTLSYCLSYWFSISIIWLVFDLMIYVPLLVHRWLDKAGIQ